MAFSHGNEPGDGGHTKQRATVVPSNERHPFYLSSYDPNDYTFKHFLDILSLEMLGLSFPFSFTFLTPGISNPFIASHAKLDNQAGQAPRSSKQVELPRKESVQVRPRPSSPSLSPSVPLSRKRGWVPSSEPSLPEPTHASTTGYLDTPAKYRDMATPAQSQDDFEELIAGT